MAGEDEVTRAEIDAAPDMVSVIRLMRRLQSDAAGDQERAHEYADILLQRAVTLLAAQTGQAAEAATLIDEFDTLPKWYA